MDSLERVKRASQMFDDVEHDDRVEISRLGGHAFQATAKDGKGVLATKSSDGILVELDARYVESFLEGLIEEISEPASDFEYSRLPFPWWKEREDFTSDGGVLGLFVETFGDIVAVAEQRVVVSPQKVGVLKIVVAVNGPSFFFTRPRIDVHELAVSASQDFFAAEVVPYLRVVVLTLRAARHGAEFTMRSQGESMFSDPGAG